MRQAKKGKAERWKREKSNKRGENNEKKAE